MDFFDFLMNAAKPNREPGAAAESDAVLDQVPRGGSGDAFFDVPVTSVPVSDLTGGVGLPPEAPLPGTAPVFEPAPLPAELPAGPAQPAAEPFILKGNFSPGRKVILFLLIFILGFLTMTVQVTTDRKSVV